MHCRQADTLRAVLHRVGGVPRCTGKDALGQEFQKHCLLLPRLPRQEVPSYPPSFTWSLCPIITVTFPSSFASIDPTNSHASAHPVEIEGTTSFNLQQTADEAATPVSVSEITTRHLLRLKESAFDFLGSKIGGAVITVPTDFTDAQRSALIAAAKAADLEVLQIIHEPVAACLAYDARSNDTPSDKTILVVDLGGTRCDAAVVSSRGGMYTIIATAHDYELGGLQLDQVLVDHFAKEFLKRNKVDPREDARSLAKLKLEAEGTKRTLSLGNSATISIESLAGGYDFHSTVNRLRYEMLSKKVFDQIVGLAESAVAKADLDLLDIDEVRSPYFCSSN